MSILVSFCSVLFPRDVLDEILNLIESSSEGFPNYSFYLPVICQIRLEFHGDLCINSEK